MWYGAAVRFHTAEPSVAVPRRRKRALGRRREWHGPHHFRTTGASLRSSRCGRSGGYRGYTGASSTSGTHHLHGTQRFQLRRLTVHAQGALAGLEDLQDTPCVDSITLRRQGALAVLEALQNTPAVPPTPLGRAALFDSFKKRPASAHGGLKPPRTPKSD